MSYHKKYNWTELFPLLSFFVGVVVVFISQYINSSLTCHGSWPDLANGLKSFLTYFISMLFASFFLFDHWFLQLLIRLSVKSLV